MEDTTEKEEGYTNGKSQNGNGMEPLLDESAIRNETPLKNSTFCMLTLFLSISSVMMSTGIAVGSLNPTIVILTDFYNETYTARYNVFLTHDQNTFLMALTVSLMLAGGCIGAVSIQVILKFFSRKSSMILMNLTNIVSVMVLC
uniref:Major facilitator superfamily (MFS) profile domain-containing protein n=1 Tax=Ciona savignyi TaxID=51511 RepID=H2YA61_CIOSA